MIKSDKIVKIHLPGGSIPSVYYSKENKIRFEPPVYEQRYAISIRFLEHELFTGKIKKIADLGCGEMRFLHSLKRIKGIEHIVQVDVDKDLLKRNIARAQPYLSDYLQKRDNPLKVEMFSGSLTTPDVSLKNTDAILCIEVIEHLYPDVLEDVPYNIFGYIKPKLAIFTTPNADFNVLFELEHPNGFRHWDHKFEWTRNQFISWCINICERFPDYYVSIQGVGKSPPEKKELGAVSQLAVFFRKDVVDKNSDNVNIQFDGLKINQDLKDDTDESEINKYNDNIQSVETEINQNDDTDEPGLNIYELIHKVDYPYTPGKSSAHDKIIDEIRFQINRFERIKNMEKNVWEIPLKGILHYLKPLVKTIDELKEYMKSTDYEIDNDNIIIKEEYDNSDNEFDDWHKYEHSEPDEKGSNNNDVEMKEEQNLSDYYVENWN